MKSILSTLILTLTCIFFLIPANGQPLNQLSQAQPVETSKPVMNIEVKDNLLSVEASDAEFGQIMLQIAEKAKFKVEISGDIASKKISTHFKGLDMEKGIRRLLNIIKEQDYTMSYTSSGFIDKIEIYGSSGTQSGNSSSYKTTQPMQRPTPPAPHIAPPSYRRSPQPQNRIQQPQRPPEPSQSQQPASSPPAQQVPPPTIPVDDDND